MKRETQRKKERESEGEQGEGGRGRTQGNRKKSHLKMIALHCSQREKKLNDIDWLDWYACNIKRGLSVKTFHLLT